MLAWLSQVLTCPICGSRYQPEKTRLVDSARPNTGEEQTVVIHSDCTNCRSSVIFNVALSGSELFSLGVVSDLSASDAITFRRQKPLSEDDIMKLHSYLEKFDGDFEREFTPRPLAG
ncbi:MAG: hypothetical protein A2722_02350 [Candidatus Doudnabacteria bacterium RIFCSPHIGHO2_01_FULL_50_11]|uniref:Uncharacterized protein n=1 Tax=Candidatus Doudnabacteria bacterium RIFCSPHIGHO2_01_FULL_50_11 TaxID=1817828 RepID=A0A1F5PGF5_9BACT|nr:MAG: hypothetical protein A2722_02350 [Candidatus Doudnabacteria bacterium RIFCSPHIGHO2_01_FULL_50_11]